MCSVPTIFLVWNSYFTNTCSIHIRWPRMASRSVTRRASRSATRSKQEYGVPSSNEIEAFVKRRLQRREQYIPINEGDATDNNLDSSDRNGDVTADGDSVNDDVHNAEGVVDSSEEDSSVTNVMETFDSDSSDDSVVNPNSEDDTTDKDGMETVDSDSHNTEDDGVERTAETLVFTVKKIHHRFGVAAKMRTGKSYLHCTCGHVRLVEDMWQPYVQVEVPGYVDQTKSCPCKLFRRSNSFKKMNKHMRVCLSTIPGERAEDKDVPPFFKRTYNNKPIRLKSNKK